MAQLPLNYGTVANDHTGAPLRTLFKNTQDNFTDLYSLQSRIISAGEKRFAGAPTTEARIVLADAACVAELATILFIPAFMLPYDITQCPPSAGVRRVREGGNFSGYDVLAYGAVGTVSPAVPTQDSSASIQAVLSTGFPLEFSGLVYLANNLTQSANGQILYSSGGTAQIIKNANGVLFTSSGRDVQCRNVLFRGESATPAFTGHNVLASGDNFSMVNCGSMWAYDRAVKATGNHFELIGTNTLYQTADATAGGYDIEVGISGTATLYHHVVGIYTGQATGGILFTDVGGISVLGGKFGKCSVNAGTLPAGVGSNKVVGARINGAINIEIPTTVVSACGFSGGTITFALGTSGCALDDSNVLQAGTTITNNGNLNNLIVRQVAAGSTIDLKYGDDASLATVSINPQTGIITFPKQVTITNNVKFAMQQTSGAVGGFVSMDSSNQVQIQNLVTGKPIQYQPTGTGFHQFVSGGVEVVRMDASAVAGQTRMMLYDVDNATLERVTVGIADSGGAGFKVLRIPN